MLQVLFAVEQQLQSYEEEKKKHRKKQKAGKEQWKSLSKFDWLKGLKQKAGKFSIKSSASQACDICGRKAEEDKTKKKQTKTAQDQEEVDR